ncbi:hypothetical protein K7432_008885 [Basidiobolus ranarum]|uniref:Yeast cell wall synthesis Kre9/Knh1-like N-terminal domain-containing protein n=1 Tax=Basidiobolus ranarum TaxID=34480 RepID=A0ABR2VYR9_9FUNG
MQIITFYAIAASFIGATLAGIYPVTPLDDAVWIAGEKVKIEWRENNEAPLLDELKPFEIALYTGTDMAQTKLATIATDVASTIRSVEYTVPDVSPYGRFYFLRFTAPSSNKSSESKLFWTTRFTITNKESPSQSPSAVGSGALVTSTSTSTSISISTSGLVGASADNYKKNDSTNASNQVLPSLIVLLPILGFLLA